MVPDAFDASDQLKAEFAPHAERVRGADGVAYWKLTCFCGKRMLSPIDDGQTEGRCPKCGARLQLPVDTHITTGVLPVIPVRRKVRPRGRRTIAVTKDRESSRDRIKPASDIAADRLRPNNSRTRHPSTGLVSAWPIAPKGPRALAAFIDLTLALAIGALLLVCAPLLPAHYGTTTFRVAFTLLALWINEGVLQWLWHGSIGKKMCLIVVREEDGEPLNAENALLRPFVKLLLLPTWPFAFLDKLGQAIHDKLLGTLVLKGRGTRGARH